MGGAGTPRSPFKLVTVNTAPQRAHRLIGQLVEGIKDQYTIAHVANVETIAEVEPAVREHQPDLLFCASMWTSEEAAEIQTIARRTKSDIATYAIPQGLQVEKGPDAVVSHLKCMVPQVLKTHFGQAIPASKAE